MGEYQNTKPMWRLRRLSYDNLNEVTTVACPICGDRIPAEFTQFGVPGGRFLCIECGKEFTIPKPALPIKRVDRPRVRIAGIECDLFAMMDAARRAAFGAGWTKDDWAKAEKDITRGGSLDEFDRRLAAWFDVVVD